MVKIGKVLLGKSATVALTLTDSESFRRIRKAKRLGAKILEVRIDRFRRLSEEHVIQKIRSLRRLRMPLIATIRTRKEGGSRALTDSERLGLFQKILPWVDVIDLEIASRRLTKILVPQVHRRGKQVILSYHNFKKTPSDSFLLRLIRKAKREGADLVKIAVTPKRSSDVARLLLLTHRHREKHLIAIAMGRLGRATRALAPLFGSLLTYSFLTRPQAPGQVPLASLARETRVLY